MKLKISNQCVCFYPIKIGIKKKGHMNRIKKKKKELIQHNVTYKKLKKKKKRDKENMVDSYKEFWYIYIYIYILNDINIEIIKLMEIYTVFWNR